MEMAEFLDNGGIVNVTKKTKLNRTTRQDSEEPTRFFTNVELKTSRGTQRHDTEVVSRWKKLEDYLTKETLRTSICIYKFAGFIKCVPFELNSTDSLRVRIFPQKWKQILWRIAASILLAMSTFKIINFFLLFSRAEFGAEMAIHIAHLITSCLFFVFMGSLWVKPEACVLMLNQHDFIFQASPGLGMGNRHWASHPLVMLTVLYFSWMQILLGFAFISMFVWRPHDSAYLYSAFSAPAEREWWGNLNYALFPICFLLEVGWAAWGLTILLLFFCYWCAIVYTINTAVSELLLREELTEVDVEAYLYLQIFCVLFNDFNAKYFSPGFNFTITGSAVLFIYVSLTSFESLNILIYLCFPVSGFFIVVLILFCYPQYAKVNIFPQALLRRMDGRRICLIESNFGISRSTTPKILSAMYLPNSRGKATKYSREMFLRKRIRAFRPFGIQISFFGYCSLNTAQVMMCQVCNNILLLLSLKF